MPKITFIEAGGAEHIVDAISGLSVMESATQNLVPGVDADCGGACACATCQVIVDENWMERLTPAAQSELDMLEFASDASPRTRLSCQITVSDELDGITFYIPESQH